MKIRKIVNIALAAVLSCNVWAIGAGCSGIGDDQRTNPGASQTLNIGYFNGGVTSEWLREMEKEYEKANPDVEILINSELKDEIKNQKLLADIENRNEDIFFAHEISYQEFVNRGLIADITDVVTNPAAEGEDTVENRMVDTLQEKYEIDGKYYAVPFYTNFTGAIYDVDLFEEKSLYIAKDGGYTSGLEGQPEKSYGKDGVPNTYDDGLPVTFDEYKSWLNYMSRTRGVIPYIWCTDDSYRIGYLDSLVAGYEGENDYRLNYTLEGTLRDGTSVTPEDAYLLRESDGVKFALEMAKVIISNRYYHTDSINGQITHIDAQNKFLRSRKDNKPIAMILEGGWWENEARATFDSLGANNEKYAYGNRRFAYMPVPQYNSGANEGETYYCSSAGVAVLINANTKQLDLAKDFLKFTLTEHAMSTFTKHVGIARPYQYDLEEGVYESLTPFGRNFWDIVSTDMSEKEENTETNATEEPAKEGARNICYVGDGHAFLKNTTYFGTYEWRYGAEIGGKKYVEPFLVFLNQKDTTAAQYLQGMKDRYPADEYKAEYNRWLASQK